MTESPQERHALARPSGAVSVYAVAASIASAVPVPFVDSMLAATARGAAMRRVAQRYGVSLAPSARKILADPELPRDVRVQGYRVVRSLLQRVIVPMRMVSRFEDAFAALAAASLFDAYLRTRAPEHGPIVTEAEAKRVRTAIDRAVTQGLADLAAALPRGVGQMVSDFTDAVRQDDGEGRKRHEAAIDTLLDAIADIPEGVLAGLHARFEQELATFEGAG